MAKNELRVVTQEECDHEQDLIDQIKEEKQTIVSFEEMKESLSFDIKRMDLFIYYSGLKIASLEEEYKNLIEVPQNEY